jgi:6-phosphogluconolactonase (cycloisomerase 2 family)
MQRVEGETNPSFVVVEPGKRFLYSIHGGTGNQVSAFAIDQASGRLSLLNRQPSHGDNPVFPAVDAESRWLVVANYLGGSIAAYPLASEGRIGEATDVVTHAGSLGPNPDRQDRPHPHQITWDVASRFLFVPDLGQDRTYVYRLSDSGKFVANDPPFVASPPGSGPRHIAFHPTGRWAYLIHEMGSLMTAFAYDGERGVLEPRQTISTLPTDFTGFSTAAEVAVSADGRFVFGSNRGHDSIVSYAVDENAGTLTPIDWASTLGRTPRHFALDPPGQFLYAENQDSDTVVPLRVDAETGKLTPSGQVLEAGSPVCIAFLEA